jgi:hypothetical protein
MHVEAYASWGTTGGIGGGVAAVLMMLMALARFANMLGRRGRRNTSTRWPGQSPGGSGPGAGSAEPPSAPAGDQQAQDHAYWEAEQPDGTLPADGFIGDDAQADPGTGG